MEKPTWIIKDVIRIRGTEDYSPDMAKAFCERCDSPLFAQLWHIENTLDGRLWTVGSTCVKKLTGQTISELRGSHAAFCAGMADEEAERILTAKRTQFFQVHRMEMEWLDSHIERIHKVGEEAIAFRQRTDITPETRLPSIPSAEFWESLREQVHAKGVLSENQMAALHREMGLNHDAKLPEKKSKGVFSGKIESVREAPTFDGRGFKVKVTLRSDDNTLVILDINSGTAFESSISEALKIPTVSNYGGGRPIDIIKAIEKLKGLKVQATVKGNAAVGGKTYLTRPSLVAVTA